MATDVRRAASADRIDAALNYKDVAKRLIAFVGDSQFQLVETLAEAVARIVVEEFGVPWVKVSIAKPAAIQGSREVGVIIERTAEESAPCRVRRARQQRRARAASDRCLHAPGARGRATTRIERLSRSCHRLLRKRLSQCGGVYQLGSGARCPERAAA